MTIRDLVIVSLGEIVLAVTFVIGVLVGISICTRKDSQT